MVGIVWVVDDRLMVAESLTMMLGVDGIPCEAIEFSQKVLDRLEAGEMPRVLVLDLHMPDPSGADVIRRIKEHKDWTFPIIVLSGYSDELPEELKPRVHKVLTKAIDPGILLETVKRLL